MDNNNNNIIPNKNNDDFILLVPEEEKIDFSIYDCIRIHPYDKAMIIFEIEIILGQQIDDITFIYKYFLNECYRILKKYKYIRLQTDERCRWVNCRTMTEIHLQLYLLLLTIRSKEALDFLYQIANQSLNTFETTSDSDIEKWLNKS
jgi:hypothetical protein